MASNLTPLAEQTRHMVAQTKTLLNEQLRKVLKEEGLAVSGVKSELQLRIINRTAPRSPPSSPQFFAPKAANYPRLVQTSMTFKMPEISPV
jgi:E3 SUMO-protein ligase PIAS1